jgi:hypothetical protein
VPKFKPIVEPKRLWLEHALELKHIEGLPWGDGASKQANHVTLRTYNELSKIPAKEKKRRFVQRNVILKCFDYIMEIDEMPSMQYGRKR